MTDTLREFNRRMELETGRGTHTQFMETLSPGEARAYLHSLDLWLVGANPKATDQDYYWRSMLSRYFFPDPEREKADLECAVALDPGNVDLWVSLGHMAREQGGLDEAIRYYGSGIKVEPGNFFPWYGRAMVYSELGQFDDSLHDINKAIEIHPYLAYGYEARGRIYDKMGELGKAVEDLDFAMRCNASTQRTQEFRTFLRNKLRQKHMGGSE